ncbi:MAG: hypothetical protein R6V10_06545 [bacterium]
MKSHHITEILVDLLYDELPEDRKKEALAHLEECTECAREYEELKKTVGAFQKLPDPEPPAHLKTRIMARARDKGRPNSRRKKVLRPALAAAAALVVGLSLFVVFSGPEQKNEVASSDDWYLEAAREMDKQKKAEGGGLASSERKVTPPRLLSEDSAGKETSLARASTAGRDGLAGATLAGATLEGSTLSGALGGSSVLAGGSPASGATVVPGESVLVAKRDDVLSGRTATAGETLAGASVTAADGASASVEVSSTIVKDDSAKRGDTIAGVARLDDEPNGDFLLAREDEERMRTAKSRKPEKEAAAPEEAPAPEAEKKEKDQAASWGWMAGETGPEKGDTAGARDADTTTEKQLEGLDSSTATEPGEKRAEKEKQKEPYRMKPETRRTLKRAELMQRALGCRAAISSYEEALEDMGYGSDKIPSCAPEIESTIKSALECYYKLGKGDKALKLEKWRDKVCPG